MFYRLQTMYNLQFKYANFEGVHELAYHRNQQGKHEVIAISSSLSPNRTAKSLPKRCGLFPLLLKVRRKRALT